MHANTHAHSNNTQRLWADWRAVALCSGQQQLQVIWQTATSDRKFLYFGRHSSKWTQSLPVHAGRLPAPLRSVMSSVLFGITTSTSWWCCQGTTTASPLQGTEWDDWEVSHWPELGPDPDPVSGIDLDIYTSHMLPWIWKPQSASWKRCSALLMCFHHI